VFDANFFDDEKPRAEASSRSSSGGKRTAQHQVQDQDTRNLPDTEGTDRHSKNRGAMAPLPQVHHAVTLTRRDMIMIRI
jgi:hypothetical protein